jgi:hypothetical protein
MHDRELSRLLRNARNRLAEKLHVTKAEIEHEWANALDYSVDTVRNWLRPKALSCPPDTALYYIIKSCLKEGVIDRSAALRLMENLPEEMRAELRPWLPSDE